MLNKAVNAIGKYTNTILHINLNIINHGIDKIDRKDKVYDSDCKMVHL